MWRLKVEPQDNNALFQGDFNLAKSSLCQVLLGVSSELTERAEILSYRVSIY